MQTTTLKLPKPRIMDFIHAIDAARAAFEKTETNPLIFDKKNAALTELCGLLEDLVK